MSEELYKRYRPTSLARMVGNTDTVNALKSMLDDHMLPHTILLSGPSGTGKTTIARILKTELECSDADWREQNCSDMRGIDDIREIRRLMRHGPTRGKSRIWCLDECHMLTTPAQHAILKILEDTPSYCYFFLCTTEPQKLIKTVKNRCTKMPTRLLTENELGKLVKRTARKEKIELGEEVLEDLIESASGSARSALVLLDKIRHLSPKEQSKALELEEISEKQAIDLCRVLIKGEDWRTVAKILKEMKDDPEGIRWRVLGYARKGLIEGWGGEKAYDVIRAFESHFFDSKLAGLAAACYEVVCGEN